LSIRKILGAGDLSIYLLLLNKYIVLITVAIFVAGPISYYIIGKWLEGFAYHISIDFIIIVKVFLLVLFMTLAIVSIHVLKGIRENPADRLRME
jgi:putative ABC transport system permease protein